MADPEFSHVRVLPPVQRDQPYPRNAAETGVPPTFPPFP